jgi:nitrate reductase delta subunit
MLEAIHPLKVASVLLQYPSAAGQGAIASLEGDELRDLERRSRGTAEFAAWYAEESLGELQRGYVETFDFARRHSLHLTYHLHGDSRRRGMALLELKRAYVEAGFEPTDAELPDFLPLMLEFAALAPPERGRELLERHRVAIELVRAGLSRDGSRWLAPVGLVVDGLGGMSARQLARLKRLAAEGPPTEEVGLEPFAPPEVMPR